MFAVIGEALLDMVQPVADGPYDARPGGGPLNIAVGLRRLGYPTQLLARLSTGPLGAAVRQHAETNGLDLAGCVDTDDKTTLAFATIDGEGRASYDFYVEGTADWGWTPEELTDIPDSVEVLHTGSLASVIPPGAAVIAGLFTRLHEAGRVLLSYDPNVRPALAGERTVAVATVESFVAHSHVVKTSDEDLDWLYPGESPDDVLRRWSGLGPSLVVMTAGADGCRALAGGVAIDVPGQSVDVVDTIGAGDAFESGLLAGLADAGLVTPAALPTISPDVASSVLRQATLVAALTCQRAGADPPSRDEYLAAAARQAAGD